MEGVLVRDDLDIYAAAGGNLPYIITASAFVNDGAVTIDLIRNKENPQINGIEVFDDGAPIPPPTLAPQVAPPTAVPPTTTFQDIVINCGGTYQPSFSVSLFVCMDAPHLTFFQHCDLFCFQDRCIWSNRVYGNGGRMCISMVVIPTVSVTLR